MNRIEPNDSIVALLRELLGALPRCGHRGCSNAATVRVTLRTASWLRCDRDECITEAERVLLALAAPHYLARPVRRPVRGADAIRVATEVVEDIDRRAAS